MSDRELDDREDQGMDDELSEEETCQLRACMNCNYSFPAAPGDAEYRICVRDPEFEPYIDDLFENEDYSGCARLARRKRFPLDREACEHFERVTMIRMDDMDEGLAQRILELAEDGKLTEENLAMAVAVAKFENTDWSAAPVDEHLAALKGATAPGQRIEAANHLGFLVGRRNRAAFDALCGYLRELPPPTSLPERDLRILVLRQLAFADGVQWRKALARLLVEDLCRVPSNGTTRLWYTEVLAWFGRPSNRAIAEETLGTILESKAFSPRIKARVREILREQRVFGF